MLNGDTHIALYNEASKDIKAYINMAGSQAIPIDNLIAQCHQIDTCVAYIEAFPTELTKKEAKKYIRSLITRWIRDYVEGSELP
jgi:hypothetical protein